MLRQKLPIIRCKANAPLYYRFLRVQPLFLYLYKGSAFAGTAFPIGLLVLVKSIIQRLADLLQLVLFLLGFLRVGPRLCCDEFNSSP